MAEGNDVPTDEQDGHTTDNDSTLSRRRLLQVAGAGVVGSTFMIGRGGAAESPDRLEIMAPRGSEVNYTFTCGDTIERVQTNSIVTTETDEDTVQENADGTWTATGTTADGYADAFDLHGDVHSFQPKTGDYALYLNGDRVSREELIQPPTKRLVIETPADGSVEYSFTTTGEITKLLDNGDNSAESGNDTISENSDGTWTAIGLTGNGYGDAYEFAGTVQSFSPKEGTFTLYLDGQEITSYALVGETPPEEQEREHSYSFEGTGDSWADYYLEVEDGGDLIASTLDGAVIEPDFHWISNDGTKAAGRVDPGERHAYEFDNLVLDVTIEGDADAYVDGSPSNLSWYPQPGATGDDWKSGFPWQQEQETEETTTEQREHSYSFVGTGDSWADYYLEVEDGGDMIASTLDGAVIEPDFHWISDDGTKAAGRVDPGERHAYEFDNLVLDVTIEGDADAYVDGSPSNLSYYPRPGATGDDWKGGFPWQDEEDQKQSTDSSGVGIRYDNYDGPLGGGNGMPSDMVYSASEADVVVSSMSELRSAVSSASRGDVIYVSGRISGGLDVDTPGITIAGNRGIGSDGQWDNASLDQNAPDLRLDGLSIDAGNGRFCLINSSGLEVFNCLVENVDGGDGGFGWNVGDTGATFSHSTFRDWDYYGLQVRYNWHNEANKITIQYNEFEDLGQHMVQGGYGWFHLKDNHFKGTLNHSVDHIIEVRGASGAPVSCGDDSGNAIVEHNLNEAHGSSGAKSGLVRVRGVPTDGVWVRNNKSLGNSSSTGGCHESGTHGSWGDQLVMQNASDSNDFSKVHIEGNDI